MRWWAAVALLVLAGCTQTATQAPSTTPPAGTSTAVAAVAPPGFATPIEQVPWQGAGVAGPASYAGLGGWTLHETVAPGNPFHVAAWPVPGAGKTSVRATRTVQDAIYLPEWTVDDQAGAVLLHDEAPAAPTHASLLRPADASDLPLDWHDFRCERYGGACDVASRHLHLFPQAPSDGSAPSLCSLGFETFPDGDAMHFPLVDGQGWDADATGLFGLPVHEQVTIQGMARSTAWEGDAVHLSVAQQLIPGWVGCAPLPLWDDLGTVTQFQLRLNATLDLYYAPSAHHIVLRQARATYAGTVATAGAPATPFAGNLTDEETWTPLAGPAVGGAYGDYEGTLRAFNRDGELAPTGRYLRYAVALDPPKLRLERGAPDPLFSATATPSDWPAAKLPSGVSWSWTFEDSWNRPQTAEGNASFRPHLEGPGTYSVSASIGNAGSSATAVVGVADHGGFDLACPAAGASSLQGPAPCGGGGFHWYGPMGRVRVWANVTSDTTLAQEFVLGHLLVQMPPTSDGYTYTAGACDADAKGQCTLNLNVDGKLYMQTRPGNWTMLWSAEQPQGSGETVHIDWQAEPALPKT